MKVYDSADLAQVVRAMDGLSEFWNKVDHDGSTLSDVKIGVNASEGYRIATVFIEEDMVVADFSEFGDAV